MYAGTNGVLHALSAMRVCSHAAAGARSLLNRGMEFFEGQLWGAGGDAGSQHSAGGDEFDDIGAGPELLADRLDDVVQAVGLPSYKPGVASRYANSEAGIQRARTGNDSFPDGPWHRNRNVISRAEVPNSRDTRFQGGPGMGHRFHGGDNRIVTFKGGDRIGARVQAIVHMTINEPGKKRLAPLFDHLCALREFRAAVRSNGGDTRTVKHYRGPVLPATFAIDQEDIADGDRHEERRP